MNTLSEKIRRFCERQPIINTHSHHLPLKNQEPTLNWVLTQSYAGWCGVSTSDRAAYLRRLQNNSYFFYLRGALMRICRMPEPLSVNNWDEYDRRIHALYEDAAFDLNIMRNDCRYERIVLDAYWKPGSDNENPQLYAPTFRINMFLFGHSNDERDHNGNNPYPNFMQDKPATFDEYLNAVDDLILNAKKSGISALKCAAAYDRGLDFVCFDKGMAERAYMRPETASERDIRAFQDCVMDRICDTAARANLPFQIHTGLGKLQSSNAMQLRTLIDRHPETCFSLMHGSYPWTDDVLALAHNYINVVSDICWLPIISPTRAKQFLREWIEVGDMDRITWGCDTWHSIESCGARDAIIDALCSVFSDLIAENAMSMDTAEEYIRHILHDNAAQIYHL